MVIVVTGGIGSGKSEVCRILRQKGFTAQYNADSRVKELYEEHPTLLADIERTLDCDLRDSGSGKFLPGRLAEIIFNDKEALAQVEAVIFPVLMADFKSFAESVGENVIIFESATVLEKPFFDGFGDKVILVDAPYEMRLERACRRDGADRSKVEARMANQKQMNLLSEGHIDPRIDAVITNDAGFDELEDRTDKILKQILL